MSHHSSDGPFDKKPMSDMMKQLFGEFPDGKLNKDDEGAIALMVGHDEGRVIIQFPKPVQWMGFTADQAIGIAEKLVEHARKCGSSKPFTLTL